MAMELRRRKTQAGGAWFVCDRAHDWGWGCAHRNIQTIASFLGDTQHGVINSPASVAVALAAAWRMGFDPAGRAAPRMRPCATGMDLLGVCDAYAIFASRGWECELAWAAAGGSEVLAAAEHLLLATPLPVFCQFEGHSVCVIGIQGSALVCHDPCPEDPAHPQGEICRVEIPESELGPATLLAVCDYRSQFPDCLRRIPVATPVIHRGR